MAKKPSVSPTLLGKDASFWAAFTFAIFLVLGVACIAVGKFSHWPQLWITALPVIIMLAYSTLLFTSRFLRLRDDQAGDNLYYLGFLFTLTSLGFSLWEFQNDISDEIVKNFGIAISTTIVGVALRVIFQQMRQDPLEVERSARLELAEAARKVRAELDETAMHFSNFQRTIIQRGVDAEAEIRERTGAELKNIAEGIQNFPEKITEALSDANKQAKSDLNAFSQSLLESMKTTTAAMERSASALTVIIDDVAERLKAIHIPQEVAAEAIHPIARSLSEAIRELRQRQQSQFELARAAIAAIEEASNTAFEAVELSEDAYGRNKGRIHQTIGRIRQAVRDLGRYIVAAGGDRQHEQVKLLDALNRQESNLQRVIDLLERRTETS